jgi:HpiC1 cyclase
LDRRWPVPAGRYGTIAWSNGGPITQTVNPEAVAGTTYTLHVDVGFRNDVNCCGYGANVPTVSLIVGAHTVHATGITNLFSGNWYDWTASYTATPADTFAPITIELNVAGVQGDFDNVRLTATPLPSTWTMLIAGFVGLGFFAYRGTKKGSAAIAAA